VIPFGDTPVSWNRKLGFNGWPSQRNGIRPANSWGGDSETPELNHEASNTEDFTRIVAISNPGGLNEVSNKQWELWPTNP
jgi:hypothetical protein